MKIILKISWYPIISTIKYNSLLNEHSNGHNGQLYEIQQLIKIITKMSVFVGVSSRESKLLISGF